VSNVTLHNQEYIDLLELAIGDTVAVSKRGDIIPAVERVLEKNWSEGAASASTWKMPLLCPSCQSALKGVGAHTFCPNTSSCPAQIRGRLAFFVARGQMDIENLGPETIDVLLEHDLVRDLPDLYTMNWQKLLEVPGFGEKKVALIREGILASKRKPYRAVLPALGIPELGQKVTELLLDAGYRSIDDLLKIADAGDPTPLLEIHGIGDKTAERLVRELSDPTVRERIERLRTLGLSFSEKDEAGERGTAGSRPDQAGSLAGTVWCVTGSFQSFRPRERATEEVLRRGGRVTSSVTSKTTHLLAGEGVGSKLARAQELGVTVVDEAAFLRILSPSPER
jgi:DNA ligase (NAD+)